VLHELQRGLNLCGLLLVGGGCWPFGVFSLLVVLRLSLSEFLLQSLVLVLQGLDKLGRSFKR
jgi:hypothetical protein